MRNIKISKKKIVIVGVLGIILILCIILYVGINSTKNKMTASRGNQSAEAKVGEITSVVSGTGNLEMNELVDVTVPTGIVVKEILVESGDTVKKGQVLAKVDAASVAGELSDMKEKKEDIEDQLDDSDLDELEVEKLSGEKEDVKKAINELEKLHNKPEIVAASAGVIGDIYLDEDAETSKNTTSNASSNISESSGNSSSVENTETKVLGASDDSANAAVMNFTTKNNLGTLQLMSATSASEEQNTKESSKTEENPEPVEPKVITDYSHFAISIPVKGQKPQTTLVETDSYTGQITWDCTSEVFQPDTAYTATVILSAKDGYTFHSYSLPSIPGAYYDWRVLNEGENGNKLRIVAKYQKTEPEKTVIDNEQTKPAQDDNTDGTASKSQSKQTDNTASKTPNTSSQQNSGGSGASSYAGTSGSTSVSGTGTASGSVSQESNGGSYTNYETLAFTIQRQDKVNIYVNVDEMDILDIQEGQEVTITLDAFDNQEFSGEITKIMSEPITGNGSTKYTVEVSTEKEENMMNGMSASVSIVTGNAKNVIMVPIDALQETENKVFVYTDEDNNGKLTGACEVETGTSDSSYVEIKKGLKIGDKVYYKKTDSEEESGAMGMPGFGGGGTRGESSTESQEE